MLLLHKDPGADFVGGPRVIKACINILEAAYVHDIICDILVGHCRRSMFCSLRESRDTPPASHHCR
jgi:hypothetical protein